MKQLVLCVIYSLFAASSTFAQEQPPSPPQASSNTSALPYQSLSLPQKEARGDSLVLQKRYEEGITVYKSALAEKPRNAILLNKIAVAYQQMGDALHAEKFYKDASKADKNFLTPVNNLGTIEYGRKRYRKAIRLYKKALKMKGDPEILAAVYSNIGYAYFGDKKYPEAMASFQQALSLNPQVFERHTGFGSTVQQRDESDPGLFNFLLAKTYALSGDIERCAHYLRMARDEGYKNLQSAQTDPAFVHVIKDPRIQQLLAPPPDAAVTPPPAK